MDLDTNMNDVPFSTAARMRGRVSKEELFMESGRSQANKNPNHRRYSAKIFMGKEKGVDHECMT